MNAVFVFCSDKTFAAARLLFRNHRDRDANFKRASGSASIRGRLRYVVLGICWLAALMPRAHAQGGMPLWTNRYNGPANGGDLASAIAVDTNGNVFVTGTSVGSGSTNDFATIKYSNAGTPLWTNRYNGPANSRDNATTIKVDINGDVIVTGYSQGSGSGYDYATIKYSNTGTPLWTNRYNGPNNLDEQANALAVDTNGNVFISGYSTVVTSFNVDYATVAYSSVGVPLWTNRYNGPANGNDIATSIAVDSGGNVFVTGRSEVGGGVLDYATIKYSGAGAPLWTNRYHGPANSGGQASAVAVDASGHVFVTGTANSDYATLEYSNTGTPLWTNVYSGPGGPDTAMALALDSSGNVFVTGFSVGTNGVPDFLTVAYSGAGAPLWTNRYPTTNAVTEAFAVAVDSSGNVFVTGWSQSLMGGTFDYATVAYSGAGVPLWTNRYDSGPADIAQAIAVDLSGDVFVTGGGTGDYSTIKYSSSVTSAPSPAHLDFQTPNNQLVLRWTNSGFSLQSAPLVTGVFTNIPGATTPYTNPMTELQQYFRLKGN